MGNKKCNIPTPFNSKLVFIVPSLQLGGQENSACLMSNFLASAGFEVVIITLFKFPHFYHPDDQVKVIDPPFIRQGYSSARYYSKLFFYLKRTIRKINPRIIVSYGDWTNIWSLLASNSRNRRVFISDRASPDLKFKWYLNLLRKLLYRKAYGIIAQTNRAAYQKYKMLGQKINLRVIPNPIKEVRLFPEVKRNNIILGIGRHWDVKGFDLLIKAFSKIDSKDYQLHIAGSFGPSTGELQALIANEKLEGKVKLLGKVTELDKLCSESKIFVLSSRSEGFPNALLESMAAGLACISFDCSSGPKEIINHGVDGFLVQEGNLDELARYLDLMISDDELRNSIGVKAMEIREKYSMNKIGSIFKDFILS